MYRTSAIIQILRDFPGGICRKKPEHLKAVVKEYLKSKRRGTNHAGEIKRGSLQSKHGSSKIRTCYIYMVVNMRNGKADIHSEPVNEEAKTRFPQHIKGQAKVQMPAGMFA